MLKKEQVIEELKKVVDPELGIDIYTLGLIYNISIEDKKVNIRMTLTSPMCPYGPQIIEDVKRRINSLEGGIKVETEIVFNPPWEIPKEVRSILGI
ncbi:metal-sulfur cluster assembly factor [Candidatus Woesearchaeota archaeon]|nr:metal-sulfur cluster assembly factor [Candidatus Woesearchaeota archaeon]